MAALMLLVVFMLGLVTAVLLFQNHASAITAVGTASTGGDELNGSFSLSSPSGTATGDILVATFSESGTSGSDMITSVSNGSPAFTNLGFWKTGGNNAGLSVWYRVVQAGDPTTWTVNDNAVPGTIGIMMAYRGVDSTTPIDAQGTANGAASGTSITWNSVTTATNNAWYIGALAVNACGPNILSSFTLTTKRADPGMTPTCGGVAAQKTGDVLGDKVIASAGSSGTFTGTTTTSAPWTTFGFALRPAAPGTPTLSSPASGAIGVASLTPSLQLNSVFTGGTLQYRLKICTNQALTSSCQTPDQTVSSTGWTAASYASGTTAIYNGISTLSWGTTYWWAGQACDATDSTNCSVYSTAQSFRTNFVPGVPTMSTPASGQTGVSTTPEFRLYSSDTDNDYLQYKILICANTDSTCSSPLQTILQSSSQVGWSSQNASGSTAYVAGQTAIYKLQTALSGNTQYYWQAFAMDPAGTNSYGSGSTPQSFTTQPAAKAVTNIGGGTTIYGGVTIGQ